MRHQLKHLSFWFRLAAPTFTPPQRISSDCVEVVIAIQPFGCPMLAMVAALELVFRFFRFSRFSLRPITATRLWNLQDIANLAQPSIRESVVLSDFARRQGPDLFIQFFPVVLRQQIRWRGLGFIR